MTRDSSQLQRQFSDAILFHAEPLGSTNLPRPNGLVVWHQNTALPLQERRETNLRARTAKCPQPPPASG